jgi:SAM-dependent methyltransferase
VRADLRDLPLAAGSLDAAYGWYSSLFVFDDGTNRQVLVEAARALRPGGRLLVQHANPLALAAEPLARDRRALPGGGDVEERSAFDAATGRERLSRVLTRGGRQLAGSCELRYYSPHEWTVLAGEAGLLAPRLASTGRGGQPAPFDERSIDLIAVMEKPT